MRLAILPALLAAAASTAAYGAGCDAGFLAALSPCAHVVQSLRADKPGVARVFASDGSQYTGAAALWLKGQLRAIERACGRDEVGEASERLERLRRVIAAQRPD